MSLTELIILAVGLSMDAFAVAVCKGLSMEKISFRHMCSAGLWFGCFQALMPFAGYMLGSCVSCSVSEYNHWISFALLLVIGIGMIHEAGENEKTNNSMSVASMLASAVATSLDALAVGVTFAFFNVNITYAAAVIGIIAFLFSASGIKIGSLFGEKYKSKAQLCGGIILIIIGIKILMQSF